VHSAVPLFFGDGEDDVIPDGGEEQVAQFIKRLQKQEFKPAFGGPVDGE
jgi:hypothetical protein